MGSVQSAIPEQREAILRLFSAVGKCPPYDQREAWLAYQAEVMQPIRDEIRAIKEEK